MSKSQALYLQEKCDFFNHSSNSREHMSSLFIFGKPCFMKKIIHAEHLQSFMIHHFYQQKHISWIGVFQKNEFIRVGIYNVELKKNKSYVPECFASSVSQSRYEQFGNNYTRRLR
jgi:DNA integrity scanning protein DisA with diadenylate cyclase activity